jgi:uncharacterized protein YjiS (DUF1127 family)
MRTVTITHTSNAHKMSSIAAPIATVVTMPFTWAKRIRNRRQLMRLLGQPDYLIQDVGLQRDAIVREAIKRFWVA